MTDTILVRAKVAQAAIGIKQTTFYKWRAEGLIRPVRYGWYSLDAIRESMKSRGLPTHQPQ